ncbi:Uncharacterized protein TCM_018879 [Theobroma cacao]|uniref:DUF4218 domain-containing protein n=1 Tax=Theobroma cacao TaxID=3641 RepID=A0A061EFG8_THECC|nr:Uncharacterized protein TCM_018879 [Theobroma cacao]
MRKTKVMMESLDTLLMVRLGNTSTVHMSYLQWNLEMISHFFRDLCATEIPVDHMEALQGKICETICQLEKIFPPDFFDSTEHLSIHLLYEAKEVKKFNSGDFWSVRAKSYFATRGQNLGF